jgi:hypothetical protein
VCAFTGGRTSTHFLEDMHSAAQLRESHTTPKQRSISEAKADAARPSTAQLPLKVAMMRSDGSSMIRRVDLWACCGFACGRRGFLCRKSLMML